MHANSRLILREAGELRERDFDVRIASDCSSVVVGRISLPGPGWTTGSGKVIYETAFWFPLPPNFPAAIPGVGLAEPTFAIHCLDLQFRGRPLKHVFTCDHSHKGWFWFCFQVLQWDPSVPHPLVALLEICEASLADRAEQTYHGIIVP